MARDNNLWNFARILPSLDQVTVFDYAITADTEGAQADTGLSQGSGILHIWSKTHTNGVYQIALYGTSGNAAGAGLPVLADWNVLHDDTHSARPVLQDAFWIDSSRRYFRLTCTVTDTVQWAFERL